MYNIDGTLSHVFIAPYYHSWFFRIRLYKITKPKSDWCRTSSNWVKALHVYVICISIIYLYNAIMIYILWDIFINSTSLIVLEFTVTDKKDVYQIIPSSEIWTKQNKKQLLCVNILNCEKALDLDQHAL
jgi:hypothetical protein